MQGFASSQQGIIASTRYFISLIKLVNTMSKPLNHDNTTPCHLMLVDDNDLELKLYANGLAEQFTLTFAQSTKHAWDQINRAPLPDAILLDVMMPNEDGLAFCERLKENPFTTDIPIIFISSLIEPAFKHQAFRAGAADFIVKPPDAEELIARIKRHVGIYKKTKRLESLIFIDPLTHLPNASKFQTVLKQEWARCARYWHHVSLLLIQLEDMQDVINEYGQDEYLNLTASISGGLSDVGGRPGDLLASLDDNTFALLLSDCSKNGAKLKAEQIMERFNSPNFAVKHQLSAGKVRCTIAVTVAAPAGGGEFEKLIEEAKGLLLQSSQLGVGKIYESDSILGVDTVPLDNEHRQHQ